MPRVPDPVGRWVRGVVLASAGACAAAALFLAPSPLPQNAGSAWERIADAGSAAALQAMTPLYVDVVEIDGVRVAAAPGVVIEARSPHAIAIGGWAVDAASRRDARHVAVRVDRGPWREARSGLPRPDVAQTLNLPGAAHSGFHATVDARAMIAGRHTIGLATRRDGGAEAVHATIVLSVTR